MAPGARPSQLPAKPKAHATAPEPAPQTLEAPASEPAAALAPIVAEAAPPSAEQRRNWDGTMQRALASLVRGRLDEAKRHYEEAVQLAPTQAASYRGLGLVSARLGDQRAARKALQHYLALAPHADDAPAITARLATLSH